MKKIALLSALAVCLGFTSCDDNDIVGIPENPASAIFETSDLVLTSTAETDTTIDLKAYSDEAKNIPLCTVTVTDFPADYDLQFVMEISKDENFSRVAEVATSIVDSVVCVNPDLLQDAYYTSISKGPKEKTIYARYAGYAVKDGTSVRLGNPTFYWPNGEASYVALSVQPFPSSLVIEDNYYLLGTINGWSVAEAIKMVHTEGVSPYDDPVFTLKVDISTEQAKDGWWWKIVPESTYITGNWVDGDNTAYGVAENGDNALSGMLIGRTATDDCGAGCINEAGPFLLTINMEDGTYDFSLAIDNLYTPGNSNGWSQASSQLLYTEDFANYVGYAHLNGEFKFSSQADWNGINYGNSGEEGKLSNDGGAGNLSAPADALYWCNVNIASLTYSLYQVTTIGVVGDATPGGWDASTALTPSEDFLVWEGDINFNAGGEWKLRCNDAWDVNLGGDINELVPGGSNLATPGAGVHHVTLDLSTLSLTGKGYVVYID